MSGSRDNTVVEPNWSGWNRQRLTQVPAGVLPWLRDEGSLTRRVVAACSGRFRVRLLRQAWGTPFYSEAQLLRMRRGEMALVREVELLCDEVPWVFARTLIPASTLRGAARRLTLLGDKPLGAVLFSDSRIKRGRTQVARLQPRHRLFSAASVDLQPVPDELWGRRTLFHVSGRPLLVNEIFLPRIPMEKTS
ncbi:chorismate--pyruvate lyase family protein [Candidatus Endoriftia persephonae]|uniref:Probable chorismate pyruvate-lyase n=2 Tax=Gammaproteobacteria TaxID=1236 RepID=G2FEN3_9GAMM|nr:chorismate lyase [Candidatus Endoriftia persephone]EGW54802.1 chorismate--pyruvate lyase [endosymbiont of Tevnia jerichonana (vent Tica)]USF87316.1 chorismate lyase [Candidatus Endoriftia persephone]